jgi:hypothetical protein
MSTPEPLEVAIESLISANCQLDRVNQLFINLEEQQTDLIRCLQEASTQLRLVEAERNAWRERGELLELERNQWESKAGELELKLHRAWRVAAELGVRTGEARCPNCGSSDVHVNAGDYGTGVFAPDGTEEHHYQCCLKCNECGHFEELVP